MGVGQGVRGRGTAYLSEVGSAGLEDTLLKYNVCLKDGACTHTDKHTIAIPRYTHSTPVSLTCACSEQDCSSTVLTLINLIPRHTLNQLTLDLLQWLWLGPLW